MCSKWAGGLGGSWTAVRGTGSHIESHERREPGRRAVPQDAQRPARRRQPGRQAGGLGLRVPRGLAQRHPRVPRAAAQHGRRAPPHARHEHGVLDPRPVHAARGGARAVDAVPLQRRPRPPRPLRRSVRGALRGVRGARGRRASCTARSMPAIELWKAMLRMLFETGHPWITFKDPCNVRSPQDHAGVVHSSNLCTEITLNTSDEETAVCNLGSIVLDQHLTPDGELDHAKLRETVRIAVRALDDVIDVNFYPTEPARTANKRHRPVGLGVMGLQYALLRARAWRSASRGGARVRRRGDGGDRLLRLRGVERPGRRARALRVVRGLEVGPRAAAARHGRPAGGGARRGRSRCRAAACWTGTPLRAKIAAQGMRNSNVLAIAPTATIANIMGTSPCIEPMYKQPVREVEPVGRLHGAQPVPRRRPQGGGAVEPRDGGAAQGVDGDLRAIDGMPGGARRALPDGVPDRARVAHRRGGAARRSGSTSRSR